MSLSAATTTELQKFFRRLDLKLELRTAFSASSEWLEYPWSGVTLRKRRNVADALTVDLPLTQTVELAITAASVADGTFSVAGDQTWRFRQYVSFEVNGSTGNDDNYSVSSAAYLRGGQTVIPVASVADGTADGTVRLYGNWAGERSQVNRTQLAAEARITARVMTASGLESARLFTGRIWEKTAQGGAVSMQCEGWDALINETICEVEAIPSTLEVVGESTYRELALLGDPVGALATARIYGFVANGHGTLAITGGSQGSQQFTVAGDWEAEFAAGVTFRVIGSTGNDALYTVDSASHSAGTTTITVDEAIAHATLDGEITDSAFDESTNLIRRPWNPGNIRIYYHDGSDYVQLGDDKYTIDYVSGAVQIHEDDGSSYYAQQVTVCLESAATGATDVDLATSVTAALQYAKPDGIGATSGELDISSLGFDHPVPYYFRGNVRDFIEDIQSRLHAGLRLRWKPELGTNGKWTLELVTQNTPASPDFTALHVADCARALSLRDIFSQVEIEGDAAQPVNLLADATQYNISSVTTEDWFKWDGFEVQPDALFGAVQQYLHDGNLGLGTSVHNLPASVSPGTDKYDSWFPFVAYDLGELKRPDDALEFWMPRSRHPEHQQIDNKDGTWLWPGVWVQVSEDSTTGLDGSWTTLAAAVDRVRYKPGEKVRVEPEQFLRHRFRWVRFQCGAYKHGWENNLDPSAGFGELRLLDQSRFRIQKSIQSTSGSYQYTSGGSFDRQNAGLLTRLQSRHRTHGPLDFGRDYPEALAHDIAVKLLDEDLRLHESIKASLVIDPRLDIDQTIAIPDALHGSLEILAEEVSLVARAGKEGKPGSAVTTVSGVNYQADPLDNP